MNLFNKGDIVKLEGDRDFIFYEVGVEHEGKLLLLNNTTLVSNFYVKPNKLTLVCSVQNRVD